MKPARQWLAITLVLAAAAMAGQPVPATPPATSGVAVVPAPGAATPATAPAATPDDEFIEFLGADDDAVRWNLTDSAQRKGRPPAVPAQDAKP